MLANGTTAITFSILLFSTKNYARSPSCVPVTGLGAGKGTDSDVPGLEEKLHGCLLNGDGCVNLT